MYLLGLLYFATNEVNTNDDFVQPGFVYRQDANIHVVRKYLFVELNMKGGRVSYYGGSYPTE